MILLKVTTAAILRELDGLNQLLDAPYDHQAGFTRKSVEFLAALLPLVSWADAAA